MAPGAPPPPRPNLRGPGLKAPDGSEWVSPRPPLVPVSAAAALPALRRAGVSEPSPRPRPRGAGMHCFCGGSSSWRRNGWRFPAASWTISAGTAAPAPSRPVASSHWFSRIRGSQRPPPARPQPCPRFPAPPSSLSLGTPLSDNTTPAFPPQPQPPWVSPPTPFHPLRGAPACPPFPSSPVTLLSLERRRSSEARVVSGFGVPLLPRRLFGL